MTGETITGSSDNITGSMLFCEYSPTITPDGKMLIYQSRGYGDNVYKLHVKYRTPLGWTPAVYLRSVNTLENTGGPFVTYDQNSLLLTSDQAGGKGDADLWISTRNDSTWGAPVNMGSPINTSGYEGFGSLSPDGNTLYFVRDGLDKQPYKGEKFALFMAAKKNGVWSEPVRMPSPVNSAYSDFAPVILADGKTLIFSSARPGGFGGFDLYKTECSENGKWSMPVNLGPEINTEFEDRSVAIPASGDMLYHTRPIDAAGKIYRIVATPLPPVLRHTSVVILGGTVSDSTDTGRKLHAVITITDVDDNGKQVIESNKGDGAYHIVLNKGKMYDAAVSCAGYMFYSTTFDLRNVDKFSEIMKDITLDAVRVGGMISMNNLYFKTNSAIILPESRFELKRVSDFLKENPKMNVEIRGYTDDRGSASYNMKLSYRRAAAVYNYMVKNGISSRRMSVRGFGEDKVSAKSKDTETRSRSRRVEMGIMSM